METPLRLSREYLIAFGLIVLTLAAYSEVPWHDFIAMDDPLYLSENFHVRDGLTGNGILWAFTTGYASNWHPLTWISHMVDCQLFGPNAAGHHLMNLLFHVANAVLVFVVLRRMTAAIWQSAFVAALFALHPLHVESVAWIAERKDVLSTLFWLLTMFAYARYVEQPGLKRYLLVLLFFTLGLMAKPMLVTLPFVLLLLDYWPLRRFQLGLSWFEKENEEGASSNPISPRSTFLSLVREKIPLFILVAVSSVTTFLVQQSGGAVQPFERLPFDFRLANALVSYVSYIGKMIWPSNLAIFYPHPRTALLAWQAIASGVLLLILTGSIIWAARSRRYVAVGWLWYIGTLVPVIGLIQVGAQAMADRYTYVPLLGLFIILAWGVPDILSRWRVQKNTLAILSGVLVPTLMAGTWFQVGYWRDSYTVFDHAAKVTSGNWMALDHLGADLYRRGKPTEALSYFYEALRVMPAYPNARNNLGLTLMSLGQVDGAIIQFKEALRIKPDFMQARYNLSAALVKRGRVEEAINNLSEAIQLHPDYADGYVNIGIIRTAQGKNDEAIESFSQALRIDPQNARAHAYLAVAYEKQGKIAEAIEHFSESLRLNPRAADTHNNLGTLLARQGNLTEAIAHYQEALRIKPDYKEVQMNLEKALKVQRLKESQAPPGKP